MEIFDWGFAIRKRLKSSQSWDSNYTKKQIQCKSIKLSIYFLFLMFSKVLDTLQKSDWANFWSWLLMSITSLWRGPIGLCAFKMLRDLLQCKSWLALYLAVAKGMLLIKTWINLFCPLLEKFYQLFKHIFSWGPVCLYLS